LKTDNQRGRPLRNRNQAEAEIRAAPGDPINLAENARHIAHRLLRRKGVGLLQHKPKRIAIGPDWPVIA
jgi:hypothetical protein